MIKSIRACKTSAEERSLIAKESAAIRASLKEKVRSTPSPNGAHHRNEILERAALGTATFRCARVHISSL